MANMHRHYIANSTQCAADLKHHCIIKQHLPVSADQCTHGNMYLRSNTSRKATPLRVPQGAEAKSRLWTAIIKSHGSSSETLIRAMSAACLDADYGFQAHASGYLMRPVSYSLIMKYVKQGLSHDLPDSKCVKAKLTKLLKSKHQQYFTAVHGPPNSEPHVVVDLKALVLKPHQQQVHDVLASTQIVPIHPSSRSYQALYQSLVSALSKSKLAPGDSQALTAAQPTATTAAPFVMVESAGQAAAVYATSKATGRIGLDCEGVRLSRSGRVCLVQVQAGETCYMFDVLKASADIMSQLKAMLEDVSVIKIIHDSRNDSVSLFYQKGIKIQNIFDTQVAYGLVGLWDTQPQQQDLIGLARLLTTYGLPAPASKQAVTKTFKGDFGMWKRRPIPQDLLQYAADDVAQLPLLADKLIVDMGKAQLQLLARLSAAWSQSMWSASDKEFSKGYGSIHAFPSTGSWLMQVFAVAKKEL